MTDQTPLTEAGRRLNDYLVRSIVTTDERRRAFTTDILAIEAAAAAAEREKYRALVFALTNEGPKPEHHRRVMARHRQEWPALWRAIDAIALAALEDSPKGSDARARELPGLGGERD